MTFDTSWNVRKYKYEHEMESHWKLKEKFLLAHKNAFPEEEVAGLAQTFYNIEVLGCVYDEEVMEKIKKLSVGLVNKTVRTNKQGYFNASAAISEKVKARYHLTGTDDGIPRRGVNFIPFVREGSSSGREFYEHTSTYRIKEERSFGIREPPNETPLESQKGVQYDYASIKAITKKKPGLTYLDYLNGKVPPPPRYPKKEEALVPVDVIEAVIKEGRGTKRGMQDDESNLPPRKRLSGSGIQEQKTKSGHEEQTITQAGPERNRVDNPPASTSSSKPTHSNAEFQQLLSSVAAEGKCGGFVTGRQRPGMGYEQQRGPGREQHANMGNEQRSGMGYEQRTGLVYEQRSGMGYEQRSGMGYEQRIGFEPRVGIRYENQGREYQRGGARQHK